MSTPCPPQWHCYLVRPSAGQWEVSIGGSATRFLYATLDDAVRIARNAAQQHWQARNAPCCVCVEAPGQALERVATFGEPQDTRPA
jgi:hypothetical protein